MMVELFAGFLPSNVVFHDPQLLYLLPLVLAIGLLLAYWRGNKALFLSRAVIVCLLIIALAGPYTVETRTVEVETPSIAVVQDETGSMGLYTQPNVYERVQERSPADQVTVEGEQSSIGDVLVREAGNRDIIYLVSDGQVTHGVGLHDALMEAAAQNTTIYAVEPSKAHDDLAVEIVGSKNVIQGTENTYTVQIRQTNGQAKYTLKVWVDSELAIEEEIEQENTTRRIPLRLAFDQPGAHTIRAKISAEDDNWFEENDEFIKTIWTARKPPILLVTQYESPLSQTLLTLYNTTTREELGDLGEYKAVVLDDQSINSLSNKERENLTRYVVEGGGLVVVGGPSAYEYGGYLNSSLEAVLPVVSRPATFRGGEDVVIIIDTSGTTGQYRVDGHIVLDVEKANAVHLINNLDQGDRVAVVGFSGNAYHIPTTYKGLVSAWDTEEVEQEISRLKPMSETRISEGLHMAKNLLNESDTAHVVVLSDGMIQDYSAAKDEVQGLMEQGVEVHLIRVVSPELNRLEDVKAMEKLATDAGCSYQEINAQQRVSLDFGDLMDEETTGPYRLTLTDEGKQHFIADDLEPTGNITGYNDVSPKSGATRVLTTGGGKPVITTWKYGLGRVVSVSTDNGNRWSGILYSNNNSGFVSRTINWAVADPRTGDVVTAPDGWKGTPIPITVESDGVPEITIAGEHVGLQRVARTEYEGEIPATERGVFEVSDYPVAINYPLEYRNLGMSENLRGVGATGGEVITPGEVQDTITESLKRKATKKIEVERGHEAPLLWLILPLFLLEIAYRRLRL